MSRAAERVRVGIAGYGAMGKRRRAAIDADDRLELIAVADPNVETVEPPVRRHATLDGLFEERLDALFVCVPTYLAASTTERALAVGLHVFCEKPPARSVAELERVQTIEAASPGRVLAYGFNHRQHGSVRRALDHLRSGALGRLLFIRGVYGKPVLARASEWRAARATAGGGILLDQGIHLCDLLRVFGGEWDEVLSMRGPDTLACDVEQNAFALLRNANGVVASLHSSATEVRPRFRVELGLEDGMLVLDGILSSSGAYAPEVLSVLRRRGGALNEDREAFTIDDSWSREVAQFSRCLMSRSAGATGKPLEVPSSGEARATMALLERIYGGDPRFWAG
ncbi:MAG: Gfo/Idh/MocA family protein [Sandaracinaceae bacterium]